MTPEDFVRLVAERERPDDTLEPGELFEMDALFDIKDDYQGVVEIAQGMQLPAPLDPEHLRRGRLLIFGQLAADGRIDLIAVAGVLATNGCSSVDAVLVAAGAMERIDTCGLPGIEDEVVSSGLFGAGDVERIVTALGQMRRDRAA